MWVIDTVENLCEIEYGTRVVRKREQGTIYPVYGGGGETFRIDRKNRTSRVVIARFGMSERCTRYVDGDFFLNDSGLTLSPKSDELSQDFLNKIIFSLNDSIYSIGRGTAQKNLNMDAFKKLIISYPPAAEQERIVAKIDAAFAEIDEAIVAASNKEKNAEKLFENYLSNIFQTNNQDWKSDNLQNITSKIGSGATPRGGQASYKKDGISLIRSMNVHDMYFKYKNLAKIDNEQASKLSNVTVQENDILLNITGASVARCCLVERDVLPARVNQHVSIIRVKIEIVIPKFILYGLISKPYKDKLLTVGNSGGATRQAITKTQIEDFIFYYPKSKEEQNDLITKLDSVYLHTQNLAEIYKKQIKQHVQLKLAILSQELQSSEAA